MRLDFYEPERPVQGDTASSMESVSNAVRSLPYRAGRAAFVIGLTFDLSFTSSSLFFSRAIVFRTSVANDGTYLNRDLGPRRRSIRVIVHAPVTSILMYIRKERKSARATAGHRARGGSASARSRHLCLVADDWGVHP